MIRLCLLLILCLSGLLAEVYPVDITPKGNRSIFGAIKILDQKEIILPKIDSLPFAEASDLAYDGQEEKLYMVGDKGMLYAFHIKLTDKIDRLTPLSAHLLTKNKGKHFKKKVDAEGLTLNSKGQLLISFERKPKIASFDFSGQRISKHKLPSTLQNPKHYRHRNKMLESVAYHPTYGILTAAEHPLKKQPLSQQTIYSLQGKRWNFLAGTEKKSAITAIEVMDDGNLLILERAFSSPIEARVITLKKLFLGTKKGGLYRTQILAKLSSDDGWKNDNFEGLARVGPHRYLMISDDNANFFQRTLLIYFEVIE